MAPQIKIIIIHGTGGSPEGNWFPWLREQLESQGHDVTVPRFPTPEGQSFEAWRKVFVQTLGTHPPENTILISHSIGPAFALRLAEETEHPYRALIAVSPFTQRLGNAFFDNLNASFIDHTFDWPRIRVNIAYTLCFAGDNDPYVPLALSSFVAENISAALKVIPKGGHLNAEFGYLTFPELLAELHPLLGTTSA